MEVFNKPSTLSGWRVYDGENINCECRIINKDCCDIHINMRDVYTDICEFISNLILHIKFMQIHKNKTVVIYKNDDCKIYGECGAVFKNSKEYEKINKKTIINEIDLNTPPTYTVKINKINKFTIRKARTFIIKKFNTIYNKLHHIIRKKYRSNNFKIHVVQGAGKQLSLLSTNHPHINVNNITLLNKYGGKYKLYDEYIGKFTKVINKPINKNVWKKINKMNAEWYDYIYINNMYFQIIYLNKVKVSETMDPVFIKLVNSIRDENVVLLNIPYSFGNEAYYIGCSMNKIFGNKLSSFQLIGKAGGIGKQNKLNDYIIANKISIAYPHIYDINNQNDVINLDTNKVDTSLQSGENVNVYKSGMKIMPCVLFEEKSYLNKNSSEYNGVEMEGYWYSYGLTKKIPQIYLYYISDLPLKHSLAHENYPREEGQTLFNGLIRIGLDWIKNLNNT